MMDDLVQFLRARLDEREAKARAAAAETELTWKGSQASGHPWRFEHQGVWGDNEGIASTSPAIAATDSAAVQDHIADNDPAAVLREVDAKRRLLFQFEQRGNSVRAVVAPSSGGVWDDMLRLLALPYADHPDYRPEWRP